MPVDPGSLFGVQLEAGRAFVKDSHKVTGLAVGARPLLKVLRVHCWISLGSRASDLGSPGLRVSLRVAS